MCLHMCICAPRGTELPAHATGEIEKHKANVEVYLEHPAGIGEHSDVTEAVIEELNKLAAADDRLEMINKYFKNDQPTLFS